MQFNTAQPTRNKRNKTLLMQQWRTNAYRFSFFPENDNRIEQSSTWHGRYNIPGCFFIFHWNLLVNEVCLFCLYFPLSLLEVHSNTPLFLSHLTGNCGALCLGPLLTTLFDLIVVIFTPKCSSCFFFFTRIINCMYYMPRWFILMLLFMSTDVTCIKQNWM